MPLLYRDLIAFIISFISLLVNIIPEPVVVVTFLSSSFISPFTKFFVEFLANIGAPLLTAFIPVLNIASSKPAA